MIIDQQDYDFLIELAKYLVQPQHEVPPGLDATMYLTGDYQGDVAVINKLRDIMFKYVSRKVMETHKDAFRRLVDVPEDKKETT
jgi:hypothetical protein